MIRFIFYGALMWGVCLYAFFRGGRGERIAAASLLVATYSTALVASPMAMRFQGIEVPIMMVDGAFFLVLIGISLKSEKFWPLWLTAMQGLTLLSHFAPYVPHVLPWAYGNALAIWSYPMLIALAFAVHGHHRSRRGGVSYGS
ncbi:MULTISPECIES: hypothetical protein [unclassified Sphingomonas]|uniref:hypothetical protein n=1 Tax=unclassified Sphingomonas TaxID=196159 RepID=UPI0006F417D8|nr:MULTISPECIES: hypothetical protein [unclassified Sphingomonas]KQX20040.1 hypothetical protein ASD17_09025 [Sphingomonas sp. Root1294]KQY67290.1 hypothetical protein ASD39_09085 [Sphingomonas sp. Root50]KRB90665.1 hypothetical protein ASE22_10095 [Sphingomonas sp. Root720]